MGRTQDICVFSVRNQMCVFIKYVHIADWGLLGGMDLPHSCGSHSAFSGEDDNPLTFQKSL